MRQLQLYVHVHTKFVEYETGPPKKGRGLPTSRLEHIQWIRLTSSLVVASYISNQHCPSPRTSSFWTQRRCLLAISWCWWKVCCRINLWHGNKGRDRYCNWIQAHSKICTVLLILLHTFTSPRPDKTCLTFHMCKAPLTFPACQFPIDLGCCPKVLRDVCWRFACDLSQRAEKNKTCSAAKGWSVYLGRIVAWFRSCL